VDETKEKCSARFDVLAVALTKIQILNPKFLKILSVCYSIGARLMFAKYEQHNVEVVIMSKPSRKTQHFVLHAGQN
jgi:hypothetical protein